MDWLVWITSLAIFVVLVLILRRLTSIESRLRTIALGLDQFRVRQGRIKRAYASDPIPIVDAKARTTQRDSRDIPTRGARMSTAVHREKSGGGTTPNI
jgi:hypothetical protein